MNQSPSRAGLIIVAANLAALPIAMRALLLVLLGYHNTGSYAVGGASAATAAIGLAITSPLFGRALGRYGHRRVLLTTGAVSAAAHLALVVAGQPVLYLALAAAVGLTSPPAMSSGRALLPDLVPRRWLSRAYTYNALAQELLYVAGPLWVSLWLALAAPPGALLASVALGTAGLLVAAIAVPGDSRGAPGSSPRGISPLRRPAVRTLVSTYVAYATCMGAMWVLVPAFATGVGRGDQAGLLVTCWAAGSLAGGLALAVWRRRHPLHVMYVMLLGALVVTALPLTLPTTVPQMAIALTVFGLAVAPWLAVVDELVASTAPEGNAGEAYGWLLTAGQAGNATGATIAGALADRYPGGPVFLLVSGALLVALTVGLLRRRTLRGQAPTVLSTRIGEAVGTAEVR